MIVGGGGRERHLTFIDLHYGVRANITFSIPRETLAKGSFLVVIKPTCPLATSEYGPSIIDLQWRITCCRACRLSKIHKPLDCIPTAKDCVKSRDMNKKKHKTVFGDFKRVSIHERRKVAVVQSVKFRRVSFHYLV